MSAPLVSVLMPCHDAEDYLGEALDSILTQTHRDLEVVALDDGSHDATRTILEAAAERDPRIRVLVNDANLGLIRTLNRGVGECRGAFIARMDADDVSRSDRLARQLQAFRSEPDLGVVGSGVRLLDAQGRRGARVPPRVRSPDACRFFAFLGTPVVHPSVMVRAEVLRDYPYRFDPEVLHTEDYELFSRLTRLGVRIRNLDESLLELRSHQGSVSRTFEEVQVHNFRQCAEAHLEGATGRSATPETLAVLVNRLHPEVSAQHLRSGLELLRELEVAHLRTADDEAAREIRRVSREHRVDILLQALVRGRAGSRMAALAGVSKAFPALLSRQGLAYLLGKAER